MPQILCLVTLKITHMERAALFKEMPEYLALLLLLESGLYVAYVAIMALRSASKVVSAESVRWRISISFKLFSGKVKLHKRVESLEVKHFVQGSK